MLQFYIIYIIQNVKMVQIELATIKTKKKCGY